MVETYYIGEGEEDGDDEEDVVGGGFWYVATVDWVDALKQVAVSYSTGETDLTTIDNVRRCDEYKEGEEAEFLSGDDDYFHACTVFFSPKTTTGHSMSRTRKLATYTR